MPVSTGTGNRSRGSACRVLVCHYPPDFIRLSEEKRRYDRVFLNAVWETTRIPRRWLNNINRFDAIFVPTRLGLRKRTAPLTVLAHRMDERRLRGIYTLGDAFLLPTRGEGVGLPFLVSMVSGTPVIATGWGGHMDFVRDRNAFKVGYRLRRPAESMNKPTAIARRFRYLFNGPGQRWARRTREA